MYQIKNRGYFRNKPVGKFTGRSMYRGGNSRFGGGRGGSRGAVTPAVVHSYIEKASRIKTEIHQETKPTMLVNTLPINMKLIKNLVGHGYEYLMPIQEKAIPAILEGKDVIGIANTGTGKTAAFLVPIIEKIIKNPSYKALIITPTRELALQIQEEFRFLAKQMPIYSTFCIGQSSMRNQIYELRRNPHVVIGTPGRLKDLIERRMLKLETFSAFVLDEVDQMLDMGFIHDVKDIISHLPKQRQSLFFSATVSSDIAKLIQVFVTNPVTISVKKTETTSHIRQDVIKLGGKQKIDVLRDLLVKKNEFRKVLVFGRTKRGVERLSRDLYSKGFKVASIHGDKPQAKRQQAIRMFKEDVVSVLIATDVAARGLDIPDVSHVINYDAPERYEDYIHRIGRTGRADKRGTALTFIDY